MTRTLDTLSPMERVLFLRKVPLFAELAPPDLLPIASIAEEHLYADGETVAALRPALPVNSCTRPSLSPKRLSGGGGDAATGAARRHHGDGFARHRRLAPRG